MGCWINKVAAVAIKLTDKTFLTILPLMDELSVKALLEDLKKSDESVRDRATTELWRTWFNQKGDYGMQVLRRSQVSLDAGDVRHALDLLTKLISESNALKK